VEQGTRIFWGLVALLFAASAYFGVSAERERVALHRERISLSSGDIVRLARVIDGDTIVVEKGGETAVVRILGIKSFEVRSPNDPATRYGKAAVDGIAKMLEGRSVRILLHSTPKDGHGRTLATLFIGGQDVGLDLVKRGLVLVFTVYPFPAMSLYLEQQGAAASSQRGLWKSDEVSRRARALAIEWQRKAR